MADSKTRLKEILRRLPLLLTLSNEAALLQQKLIAAETELDEIKPSTSAPFSKRLQFSWNVDHRYGSSLTNRKEAGLVELRMRVRMTAC